MILIKKWDILFRQEFEEKQPTLYSQLLPIGKEMISMVEGWNSFGNFYIAFILGFVGFHSPFLYFAMQAR